MTDPVATRLGFVGSGRPFRGPVPFEWASSLSLSSAKRCDFPSLWTVPVAAALLEPLLRTSSLDLTRMRLAPKSCNRPDPPSLH